MADPQQPYLSTDPAAGSTAAPPAQGDDFLSRFRRAVGTMVLAPTGNADPNAADTAGDVVLGILKGAGHTAESLGQIVHKIPGVTAAVDALYGTPGLSANAFKAADDATTATNTAQAIGKTGEQIGEFFVPSAESEKLATAISKKVAPAFVNAPRLVQAAVKAAPRAATDAIASGATAAAQGSSIGPAAVIGGLGGAVAGVTPELSGALSSKFADDATQQVQKGLGATKESYKAMAERLTPEFLKRGIRGSREAIQERAAQAADDAGQAIDSALQQFGSRTVGNQSTLDALESAKDAFRQTNVAGQVVEIEPRSIQQLSKLQDIVKQFPDATVDQLVGIRRAWDTVVAQAGGYAHRVPGGIGMPLKDTTEAWAKREGAGAIRAALDTGAPELTALNKEYSFWKNLDDVVTQTLQRKAPQGPGLGRQVAEAAGAAAGAASGDVKSAFMLGKVAKMFNSVVNSPRWQFASAQMKDSLANAIMANDLSGITTALSRISSGATAQVTGGGTQ